MKSVRLSFCMPTYNYGQYIRTALDSVRNQAEEGVELVVLDGGSTDNTRAVVEDVAMGWQALRYVRQESRGGIDVDLARSVGLASGDYCWLLSADDALQVGAVRTILAALDDVSDIVLCNRIWCDQELKPLRAELWLGNGSADRVVDLSQAAEIVRYLADARSLGALFSFMSCVAFRREAWMRTPVAASLAGTHYAHVQHLFAMGRQGARLKYIAAPLVLCRGGSDSFRGSGLAGRLLIDLRGFLKLADELFADDPALRSSFLAVLRREHSWKRWVRARAEAPPSGQWREVGALMRHAGYSSTAIAAAGIAGAMLGLVHRNRN